jgi:hypothetical protein
MIVTLAFPHILGLQPIEHVLPILACLVAVLGTTSYLEETALVKAAELIVIPALMPAIVLLVPILRL